MGCGEGDKRCVSCVLLFNRGVVAVKPEMLEIREVSDEVQDLSTRTAGLSEGKESQGWREVSEAPLNAWHETGHLEIVYPKFLGVRECGKSSGGRVCRAVLE